MKFKREYLLILAFIYIIFLMTKIKPGGAKWEKKQLPLPKEEAKEITRYTKDFSFTETKEGKNIFQIYAKEVLSQKEKLIFLKDVIIIFYIKENQLELNCNEAKFDLEKKDSELSGKISIKFPSGLNLYTENINYDNGKGFLESPLVIYICFNNFFGKCNSFNLNIYTEEFKLKDLEITSEDLSIFIPRAEGNIKTANFTSNEKAYIFYKDSIVTLKSLNLSFLSKKILINGNCFEGILQGKNEYSVYSESFEGEFSSSLLIPVSVRFYNNVYGYSNDEKIKFSFESANFNFESGKIESINLVNSIKIEKENDEIHSEFLNLFFKEKKLENAFFGDSVILCSFGWYITANYLTYLPEEKSILLSGDSYASKGFLKINSKWARFEGEDKIVLFGGDVEFQEKEKNLFIKSKECKYEEKNKILEFRNNVVAWTIDYTLKSDYLKAFDEKIIAKKNVKVNGWKEGQEFYISTDELYLNSKEEELEAISNVYLKWKNYNIKSYFLKISQEKGKIKNFYSRDLVEFSTEDNMQSGKGDKIEFFPEKKLLILEGCPAILEDKIKGKIEGDIILVLQEPFEVYVYNEKRGTLKYKGK